WVLMPKIQLVPIVEGYDSCSSTCLRLLLLSLGQVDTIIPYIFVRKEAGIVCMTAGYQFNSLVDDDTHGARAR
ncbi:hypothetical protein ACJX0J_035817, partial [Zea mays]